MGRILADHQAQVALPELEPALLGDRRETFEQAVRTLVPAPGHGGLAAKLEVVFRQGHRNPARPPAVAAASIEAIGVLSRIEDRGVVIEPPGSHAEPLERLGSLLDAQRFFEARACAVPLSSSQGLVALDDLGG